MIPTSRASEFFSDVIVCDYDDVKDLEKEHDAAIDALRTENIGLKAHNASLEESRTWFSELALKRFHENSKLHKESCDLNSRINALSADLLNTARDLSDAKRDVQSLNTIVNECHRYEAERRKQIEVLQSQQAGSLIITRLREAKAQIKELEEGNTTFLNRADNLQADLTGTVTELNKQRELVGRYQTQLSMDAAFIKTHQERIEELEKELDEAKSALATRDEDLERDFKLAIQDRNDYRRVYDRAMTRLRQQDEIINAKQVELDRLNTEQPARIKIYRQALAEISVLADNVLG